MHNTGNNKSSSSSGCDFVCKSKYKVYISRYIVTCEVKIKTRRSRRRKHNTSEIEQANKTT